MLALLHFVDYHEKQVAKMVEGDEYEVEGLGQTLRAALRDASSPLRRWNSLPEPLRPLLFGLRTQIMTLTVPPGQSQLETCFDFKAKELQERPWEMTFNDIRSSHKLPF